MKPPAEVGSYHSPESIYCSMNPHQKLSGWKSDYQEAIKSENLGKKGYSMLNYTRTSLKINGNMSE